MYNNKESIQISTKFDKRDVNIVAKHTIRILNYNLTLTSDDDKSYIENVAERVERNIKSLSDNMPTRNMTEVALFVAMDYCDRYMKAMGDGSSMRGQIKDYLKDASFTRQQLEDAKKENELLKAENEKLRARIAEGRAAKEPEPIIAPEMSPFPAVEKEAPKPAAFAEKDKDSIFSRKKAKSKKKESKSAAPVRGFFNEDAFSESADAAADIMSFFEEKSFEDDDF